jgi:nicotinamide-nucleotide amidase
MYTHADAQLAIDELSDTSLKPFDYEFARAVVICASAAQRTIACGESVTGGLLTQLLTSVPGASDVVRGGVTAYSSDIKVSLLGVSEELIARQGAVCADVALQMAQGAAKTCGASFGIGVTGEAGPTRSGDRPIGEVHIALFDAVSSTSRVHSLKFSGTRDEIRTQTAVAAFGMLLDVLIGINGLTRPDTDTPNG